MWRPLPSQRLLVLLVPLLLVLTLREARADSGTSALDTTSAQVASERQQKEQTHHLVEYPEELSVEVLNQEEKEEGVPRRRHEAARRSAKSPDFQDDKGPLVPSNVKFYIHKKRTSIASTVATYDKNVETNESLALACLEALQRLLRYFTDHSDQLIADGFLGVAMAQGQLDTALQLQTRQATSLRPLLNTLRDTCEQILNAAQPLMDSGMSSQVRGVQKLLGPEYWKGFPAGSRGPLGEGRIVTWPLSALPPMSGTPDEVTSDHCLGQLLSGDAVDCGVSQDCWLAETAGTAMGYSLTHRLLFLQIARQSGCGDKVTERTELSTDEMIASTCGDIFGETKAIADREYPENFRDLVLEQIALCGSEGYLEFVEPSLVRSMLQWQHVDGCYGVDVFHRSKRSEQSMGDGGCLVHFTAVAAGALATSARLLLSV